MSTQTKSKLFILIIAILLITNIAMLFLLFNKGGGKKNPHSKAAAAKEFLQKEIGFTNTQLQQYDTLSKQHHEKMKAVFENMRSDKEQQFKELGKQAFNDSAIINAVTHTLQNQKLMEEGFYNHMVEVRKLCSVEQLPKFDSLFYKMWSRGKKKPEEKK
jgi:periplasmic protein CpxP/Spy